MSPNISLCVAKCHHVSQCSTLRHTVSRYVSMCHKASPFVRADDIFLGSSKAAFPARPSTRGQDSGCITPGVSIAGRTRSGTTPGWWSGIPQTPPSGPITGRRASRLGEQTFRKSAAWVNAVDDDDFLDFGDSMYNDPAPKRITILRGNSAFNSINHGGNRAKVTNMEVSFS